VRCLLHSALLPIVLKHSVGTWAQETGPTVAPHQLYRDEKILSQLREGVRLLAARVPVIPTKL
jgi:hypothetical protein